MTAQRLLGPQKTGPFQGLRSLAGQTLLKLRLGVPIFPRELREHRAVLAAERFSDALTAFLRGAAILLFLPGLVITSWIFMTRLFGGEEVSLLLWILGLGASGLLLVMLLAIALAGAIFGVIILLHRMA